MLPLMLVKMKHDVAFWIRSILNNIKADLKNNITVFPTHRLYLGGPKNIWWHIFVFITIIILLHFFFYPPEKMKPSAID